MSLNSTLHVTEHDEIGTEIRAFSADSDCNAFVSFAFPNLKVLVSNAAKAREFAARLVEAATRLEEITTPETDPSPQPCPTCSEMADDYKGSRETGWTFICRNGHEWPLHDVGTEVEAELQAGIDSEPDSQIELELGPESKSEPAPIWPPCPGCGVTYAPPEHTIVEHSDGSSTTNCLACDAERRVQTPKPESIRFRVGERYGVFPAHWSTPAIVEIVSASETSYEIVRHSNVDETKLVPKWWTKRAFEAAYHRAENRLFW